MPVKSTLWPDSNGVQAVKESTGMYYVLTARLRDFLHSYRHLGGITERPDRFPKLDSYQWKAGCEIPPFRAEEMIRDLVSRGGWLILGGQYLS